MTFAIRKIDHVVLRVADMERAIRFYTEVLGCRLERSVEEYGLVQLRAGSGLIDLVDVAGRIGRQGGEAPAKTGRNVDHLALKVEPFDAKEILAHLKNHDVPHSELATRYGADGMGPSIYIEDPDGNTVELKGSPADDQPEG
ncbi:MAG: VOC family protein [Alphaproteobacteria bacterium]|nr:VOC family protein [Alphaproteobacteria bacterium]